MIFPLETGTHEDEETGGSVVDEDSTIVEVGVGDGDAEEDEGDGEGERDDGVSDVINVEEVGDEVDVGGGTTVVDSSVGGETIEVVN